MGGGRFTKHGWYHATYDPIPGVTQPPQPSTTVVAETADGQAPSAGVSSGYSRADHTHGTPAGTTAHEAASDPHAQYQKESEKDQANGYAGLNGSGKLAGAQQTYGAAANTACEGNDARLLGRPVAPSASETVPAGYSAVVKGRYAVASSNVTTIGANAVLAVV